MVGGVDNHSREACYTGSAMSVPARFFAIVQSILLLSSCIDRHESSSTGVPQSSSEATTSPASEQTVELELHTDLVCPWCFIAVERLDQVLSTRSDGPRVVVRHRAFLLEPNPPPEGIDVAEKLRARLGRDPRELFARAEAAAKESGIELDLSKQPRQRSTVAAHALLRHAEGKGTQRALERAMFRAHFHDAANLSDPNVLSALAQQHGFTADEASRITSDPAEHAAIHAEARAASQRGVRGVPYFAFEDGRTLSGAQSIDTLRAAIDEASKR